MNLKNLITIRKRRGLSQTEVARGSRQDRACAGQGQRNRVGREHGVSDSRVRRLIAEDRVFPRQRLDNGRYIMFANSVIVAPYQRPKRKLPGSRIEAHNPGTPGGKQGSLENPSP